MRRETMQVPTSLLLSLVTLLIAWVNVPVTTNAKEAQPVSNSQTETLKKELVRFVHHDKVTDSNGQAKHVSSPYVQLSANTTYYILVSLSQGHVALYKRTGISNTNCFDNECWSLLKSFSDRTRPTEDTLRFPEDVKLLITSWPMGFFENRSCEVVPTTQGVGLKFTFSQETNNVVRIAKSPLRLR